MKVIEGPPKDNAGTAGIRCLSFNGRSLCFCFISARSLPGLIPRTLPVDVILRHLSHTSPLCRWCRMIATTSNSSPAPPHGATRSSDPSWSCIAAGILCSWELTELSLHHRKLEIFNVIVFYDWSVSFSFFDVRSDLCCLGGTVAALVQTFNLHCPSLTCVFILEILLTKMCSPAT